MWKLTNVQMAELKRVNKIGNKNLDVKVSTLFYIKGKIWELVKLWIVRNIKWTNDSEICQFSESNFGFPNWENFRNLLIFQIPKFQKFPNFTISKLVQILLLTKS